MIILPIRHLTKEDSLFNPHLTYLASLARSGLPVADGISLTVPDIFINYLKGNIPQQQDPMFDQKILNLRKQILTIKIMKKLAGELEGKKRFLTHGVFFNKKEELWKFLLEEIFDLYLKDPASAEKWSTAIIFYNTANTKPAIIEAYYNPESKKVVLSDNSIENNNIKSLIGLVLESNQKLTFPFSYQFILSNNILISAVLPLPGNLGIEENSKDLSKEPDLTKYLKKTAAILPVTKIYQYITPGKDKPGQSVDGKLILMEDFLDQEELVKYILRLNPDDKILLRLPDVCDKEKVSGSIRLLNQKSLLTKTLGSIQFLYKKKGLKNIEVGIPLCRQVSELMLMKSEVVKTCGKNINFWLEVSILENIINIDKYMEEGVKGILLNIDKLQKNIIPVSDEEERFYHDQNSALIRFLEESFFKRTKGIPILVMGKNKDKEELMKLFLKQRVYGLVAGSETEAGFLKEHLLFMERKIASNLLLN